MRGNQALLGSFAIDLVAMIFGMPRALFAVLSVSVYHAGAVGAGALYSAVAAGATVSALTTGWLRHFSRLGRVAVCAVTAWGVAIALAGLAGSLWIAAVLFAIAGAADSVSAVCRTTINQSVTPEHMRGRMSPSTRWWFRVARGLGTSSRASSPARPARASPWSLAGCSACLASGL